MHGTCRYNHTMMIILCQLQQVLYAYFIILGRLTICRMKIQEK